jgi:hypothetical protein
MYCYVHESAQSWLEWRFWIVPSEFRIIISHEESGAVNKSGEEAAPRRQSHLLLQPGLKEEREKSSLLTVSPGPRLRSSITLRGPGGIAFLSSQMNFATVSFANQYYLCLLKARAFRLTRCNTNLSLLCCNNCKILLMAKQKCAKICNFWLKCLGYQTMILFYILSDVHFSSFQANYSSVIQHKPIQEDWEILCIYFRALYKNM